MAHEGGAIPADLWTHWNVDWLLLLGLVTPAYLYMRGARTYPVERWRTVSFATAMAALFIALISPLDAVSESLFSAHMVQHLLLILAAAPLLVVSHPLAPILRGVPRAWRRTFGSAAHHRTVQRLWASVAGGAIVVILHIVALSVWHLPSLYSAALHHPSLHILEHASFFLTAALYWWMICHSDRLGGRVLSIFVVMMASGLLGALMTFSGTAWYGDHAPYVEAWGLTLLEDQQLAGLFMWIPAGILYAASAALFLGAWLHAVEQRIEQRAEQRIMKRERQMVKEMSDA
jgi:cytochrome c oxidase assembly factor CtaG